MFLSKFSAKYCTCAVNNTIVLWTRPVETPYHQGRINHWANRANARGLALEYQNTPLLVFHVLRLFTTCQNCRAFWLPRLVQRFQTQIALMAKWGLIKQPEGRICWRSNGCTWTVETAIAVHILFPAKGIMSDRQERNEVRWRPGQEASLTTPCSNLRSFESKSSALK